MNKMLPRLSRHCFFTDSLKSLLLLVSVILILTTVPCYGQGVGINPTGNPADTSAGLDVNFTNKGILIPRMSIAQRNAIYQPATGLLIYNTDCNTFNYNAGTPSAPNWVALLSTNILPAPGAIAGLTSVCSNQQGVAYSIPAGGGATTYTWTVPSGATIVSGQGTTSISVDFGNNYGNICVTAGNSCGTSSASCVSVSFNASPLITSSPLNSAVCAGTNTTFSVTATGSGLTYQWQEYISSWNNLSNTPPYSNVTTSTMNITNAATAMDNYQYRCVVSGICPPSPVFSNAATLNVYAVPSSAFTWSPTNPNTGQATTFTPVTTGAIYSWTFQSGTPSSSTAQNPAVTWSTTGTYNVSLTVTQNGCSSSVTTNPVTVIYCPHSSQTFTYNGSAQTWTVPGCITSITVDALGAGGGITPGSGATAGSGGRITATIPVTSGQVLTVIAGGLGQDGLYNRSGSGGGGFSGVLDNSGNHLVSAGGGGGSAGNESCPSVGSGGNGGGNAGSNGSCGAGGAAGITNTSPTGGAGGTATIPGSPGTSTGGGNGGATTGDSGTGGGGGGYGTGTGASLNGSCGGYSGAGGFGGGGSGGTGGCGSTQERLSGGGGGGGGFNGGAGGNVTTGCGSCGGGGGGGGRNYAIPGATVTTNSIGGGAGMQTSGSVTITW